MNFERVNEGRPFEGYKPFGTVTVNGISLEIGLSMDSRRVVAVGADKADLTLFNIVDDVDPATGKFQFNLVPSEINASVLALCQQDPHFSEVTKHISKELVDQEEAR